MLLVLLVTLLCGSIPVLFHSTVRFVEKSLLSYFCSCFFDSSRSRSTILNRFLTCIDFSIRWGVEPQYLKASSTCLDSSIRRGVVLLMPRLFGYFTSRFVVESIHNTQTPLMCFDFSIRRNPVPIPCFPLTFSFPLRTQLYILVQVLLL